MSRILLGLATYTIVAIVLLLPPTLVFVEALRQGLPAALATFADPDAQAAIWLTVEMTALSVAVNTTFGILAAWALSKFTFPGRGVLLVLIELPLSVSPVVAGLVWLLLFGSQGWWGAALARHGITIAFAAPGILLATIFVTFPYVARTLLPLMQRQGRDAEEAALLLGAGFWQILWRVTLPGARWALLSGILLTTARAMGEFGAVSVISGHIPGLTETMPLHIETLYNGYQTVAAFAMAALLALMAMTTVALRGILERQADKAGAGKAEDWA
ncbi:sulfate ABC transporter permease subunit CysW [Gluconacetobacter azotocaptans]|uniref:Sulfate ABC transporter permease subunit CysW n=1 Tax=Gluconacetobacter azotocaptans TaxID=142834 RepID=A0A7W4JTI5_9PROT|nr:sulfate ABC transporter permease subunit CysW [Gluconacetobacter azotocaptans]MBB2190622.1 sulfate ABC transporter permease subunit CysW [Gluconacetobacter azotocaptans]MBM9402884.1 sulfate ABC transporter permease subunit CysW [Gluconacetobacter azotocaptans]GBQ32670.1 sulfate transporter permease CysW [Gluconacetobacter azotocaptans DSM 13594]